MILQKYKVLLTLAPKLYQSLVKHAFSTVVSEKSTRSEYTISFAPSYTI